MLLKTSISAALLLSATTPALAASGHQGPSGRVSFGDSDLAAAAAYRNIAARRAAALAAASPANGPIALLIDDSFRDPFNPAYICRQDRRIVWVCHWIVDRCSRERYCYPEWRNVVTCQHEGVVNIP